MPEDSELYYVDESGFDEYYSREYGYVPCGEKVIGKASGKHFARSNAAAAKNGSETAAPFAFSGSMDGGLFEGRIEHVFVPALKNPLKSVLVLDNAPFHRKSLIYDISDEYWFKVIFLPPYSPDLNPIEKLWTNFKKRLSSHMHKSAKFQDALSHAFN